ncbi:MAG: hypothetical protein II309_06805 [Bacilli bacterium]|nr:hypothetical protein [Bacilli bacterium]
MKMIKNNIEIIVALFIIFFIFVTLVVFYEEKLDENINYYDNTKSYIAVLINYESRVNDTTIIANNGYRNYLELDKQIVDTLKVGSNYEIRLEPNENLVELNNLTKLFQTYEVIGVYEKVYNE